MMELHVYVVIINESNNFNQPMFSMKQWYDLFM